MEPMTRRGFLARSASAGLALSAPRAVFADERPMPTRALGKTGRSVSLAGLGCHPLARGGLSDDDAVAVIRRALDLGITYFDTAPSYGRGRSESRVGRALAESGKRQSVFLATKTLARDRDGAHRELDESLRRLRTDHVDLWQFHALARTADTDRLLAEDGALAAAREEVKAGRVKHVGITGHADPAVFVDALERHGFETLLIPLNCIDPHHSSFERIALPVAREKGTGVIAMKVFCSGRLPAKGIVEAEACLRYTYALPIATCVVGCDSLAQVELAAHVARNLEPLTEEERGTVLKATKAHSPGLEWYKSGA